jgi:uncharacterized protein (DUF342 family)
VPRLSEFYPGICLTNEEKSRKNLSQSKKNLSQVNKNLSHSRLYILPKSRTHYKALTNTRVTNPTHTHTIKQYKTKMERRNERQHCIGAVVHGGFILKIDIY